MTGSRRRGFGSAFVRRSGRWSALVLAIAGTAAPTLAAEAALVMIQSAPGRFEIAAHDPSVAHALVAEAEESWRWLAGPLGLPAGFSSPIFLRVEAGAGAPAAEMPFRVAVETGGVVSVRIRGEGLTQSVVRRALIQSLLWRLAVAQHGMTPFLSVPAWLEAAGVGWWETRADAARLDAVKYIAARSAPPSIDAWLLWRRGDPEPAGGAAAAVWLLAVLQAESGREGEWPAFLRRVLAGDDPLIALVESYPGRYRSAVERELWWQTGYHQARRARTLPVLDAAESRAQLGALARFVFAAADGAGDRIVGLRELQSRAKEPLVAGELARRAAELARLVPALHPFYRNAGLSLADVLAGGDVTPRQREAASAAFEADWRDALELEAATNAALDRLERR
jgi:hypothetical protein